MCGRFNLLLLHSPDQKHLISLAHREHILLVWRKTIAMLSMRLVASGSIAKTAAVEGGAGTGQQLLQQIQGDESNDRGEIQST